MRPLATVAEVAEVAVPFIGVALGPGSVAPEAKETVILCTSAVLTADTASTPTTPLLR